jgi:trehalose 6-phosphate synthase/phosphatase
VHNDGAIILSEMAGVSKEMGEAIIINPNNINEMADAIFQALTMPIGEQHERMNTMQKRIKRYDVFKWAQEFIHSIDRVKVMQTMYTAKKISPRIESIIHEEYRLAKRRAIFLDYDGTLTSFKNDPQMAFPDSSLYDIIRNLTADGRNDVTIISGRDRDTLERWFDGHHVNLIVEHGVWSKRYGGEWEMIAPVNVDWKTNVRPVMESYVDRTPGSFIEDKNYSMVWHYRKSEPEQGLLRANELKDELMNMIANRNLEIMEGNKVIEVKNGGINKGAAALRFLGHEPYNFIMAVGDDWTDEFMFKELPDTTITIKVGMVNTVARYKIESVDAVRAFLRKIVGLDQ